MWKAVRFCFAPIQPLVVTLACMVYAIRAFRCLGIAEAQDWAERWKGSSHVCWIVGSIQLLKSCIESSSNSKAMLDGSAFLSVSILLQFQTHKNRGDRSPHA